MGKGENIKNNDVTDYSDSFLNAILSPEGTQYDKDGNIAVEAQIKKELIKEHEIFDAIKAHSTSKVISILSETPKSLMEFDSNGVSVINAMMKYTELFKYVTTSINDANPSILKKALNTPDNNDSGFYAIHLAVSKNDKNLLETLMTYGAKHDVKNKYGLTPYAISGLKGNEDCFEVLSELNNTIPYKDALNNILTSAMSTNNEYVFAKLIASGVVDDSVNHVFKDGKNIMHKLVFSENPYFINKILNIKNFNVEKLLNASDFNGATPLKLAIDNKRVSFIKLYTVNFDDDAKKEFIKVNAIKSRDVREALNIAKPVKDVKNKVKNVKIK